MLHVEKALEQDTDVVKRKIEPLPDIGVAEVTELNHWAQKAKENTGNI